MNTVKFGLSGLAVGFFGPNASSKQVVAGYSMSSGINAYYMSTATNDTFLSCLGKNILHPLHAIAYAAGIVAGEGLRATMLGDNQDYESETPSPSYFNPQ
ncbi:MAG: hypothetical protein GY816_14080 [Cytophagales bacterium]|nr:hypothetical protein [Cytophagales bacterium]